MCGICGIASKPGRADDLDRAVLAMVDRLTKRGYRFRSTCDTEVVLRLYEERGPASIAELEGMFALAVVDTSRQILLLARDPLGIKPLYYHEGEQGLVFGSEIKAILASGLYRTEVEW